MTVYSTLEDALSWAMKDPSGKQAASKAATYGHTCSQPGSSSRMQQKAQTSLLPDQGPALSPCRMQSCAHPIVLPASSSQRGQPHYLSQTLFDKEENLVIDAVKDDEDLALFGWAMYGSCIRLSFNGQ